MNQSEERDQLVRLRYRVGPDDPKQGIFYTRPYEPEFTSELLVSAYLENAQTDALSELLKTGRLQIELVGTPRALESFGTFLIALARLETEDPKPHEHLEDVQGEHGSTVHLIVRRSSP
jgi:hypothetical protein